MNETASNQMCHNNIYYIYQMCHNNIYATPISNTQNKETKQELTMEDALTPALDQLASQKFFVDSKSSKICIG